MDRILEQILSGIEDAPLVEARIFDGASLVLSRHAGAAYRFPGPKPGTPVPAPESALDIARLGLSSDTGEASLGIAAINSLVTPSGAAPCTGSGTSLLMEWAAGRDVAMIGHFAFTDKLRCAAGKLWVLELDPKEGDLPAERAADIIPRAQVVAITGTTFINHTLEGLLALARGKRIMILGPSTVMSPVLFDYGVEAICGNHIVDNEMIKADLAAGKGLRAARGMQKLILTR
ncbi:MAG: hypothetical protein JXA24_03565 [Proteobacteria bacterium]|nr:hypothetical protein [Pseudomonadota bacterium]